MKILVFAPHPDDEVIGCGGSLIKHAQTGDEITVVYMTSGEAGDVDVAPAELARLREQEAKVGGEILGIKNFIFLRYPDGAVEFNQAYVEELAKLISDHQPEVIYVPHADDAHRDHKATHRLVMSAADQAAQSAQSNQSPWTVETILGYEVWTPLTTFEYVQDITHVIEAKLKALGEHKTQIKNVAYDEAIKGLNRYRGAMTETGEYSECFKVYRSSQIINTTPISTVYSNQ